MYANRFATDLRSQVGAQRPRRVRVAHAPRRVGDVLKQVAPEQEPVVRVDLLPVDADRDAAKRLQLDAGRGDDDIGVEPLTRAKRDTGRIHVIDVVGDHVDVAVADGLVQVRAEHEAQPLIPRLVRRLEMGVDVIARRQVALRDPPKQALTESRCLAGDEPHESAEKGIAPPDEPVGDPQGQHLPNRDGGRVHFIGADVMYDGVRCSIVTWAAFSVSDGIMLTAVAPLPMTTSLLPV